MAAWRKVFDFDAQRRCAHGSSDALCDAIRGGADRKSPPFASTSTSTRAVTTSHWSASTWISA